MSLRMSVPDYYSLKHVMQIIRPLTQAYVQAGRGNYDAAHAYLLLSIEAQCQASVDKLTNPKSRKGAK